MIIHTKKDLNFPTALIGCESDEGASEIPKEKEKKIAFCYI